MTKHGNKFSLSHYAWATIREPQLCGASGGSFATCLVEQKHFWNSEKIKKQFVELKELLLKEKKKTQ